MTTPPYTPGQTVYILLTASQCQSVINDWHDRDYGCDLRVRRSKKNPGKYVIETTDCIWANRIIKWHGYVKVTYK